MSTVGQKIGAFFNGGGGNAILSGINNGIAAGKMGGPQVGVLTGLMSALPGAVQGMHEAYVHKLNPGGPRSVAEFADSMGPAMLRGAQKVLGSSALKGAATEGVNKIGSFLSNVASGNSWRASADNAGLGSYAVAQAESLGRGLRNKVAGMGISPDAATILGNRLMARAVGSVSKSSVLHPLVTRAVGAYSDSLARAAAASTIGPASAATMPLISEGMPGSAQAPPTGGKLVNSGGGGGGGGDNVPEGQRYAAVGGAGFVNYGGDRVTSYIP